MSPAIDLPIQLSDEDLDLPLPDEEDDAKTVPHRPSPSEPRRYGKARLHSGLDASTIVESTTGRKKKGKGGKKVGLGWEIL